MKQTISKRFTNLAAVASLGLAATAFAVPAETLDEVMERRGLSQQDLLSAAKTFTPTGGRDEFIVFSSGGQSGQVIVYGVPSMRLLKYISVFTPEPWQGYGFDEESKAILKSGSIDGRELNWGDTHHPAISETDGDLDGEWLFINDKSAPRIGVISLHDFETQQIVVNPILQSEHGGTFVTPNTEYVVEAAQYPGILGRGFAPLSQFNEKFRGAITYWKFDREAGRINEDKSFSLELPPYSQDLTDAGKLGSDGWTFTNSDKLNIATLDHCTRLGDLDQIDIVYLPENTCIESIAKQIERDDIPTQHDTEISCSKTYAACIEVFSMTAKYWQIAGWKVLHDQQQAVIESDEISTQIRYQRYSLLDSQNRLRIELAKTTCNLQSLGQQRNSARDVEVCLGQAYANIWSKMQAE